MTHKIYEKLKLFSIAGALIIGLFAILIESPAKAGPNTQTLPIIVYHQISVSKDGPMEGSTAISLEKFESQMHYLHEQGYVTLNMDEVIRFMKGEKFPAKVVAIHFDDGFRSVLFAVPILKRYGLKTTFWIIAATASASSSHPEWAAMYLDWEAIRFLAKDPLFDIYSHTMTHPWREGDTLVDWVNHPAPDKGLKQARRELAESRRLLEEKLGHPVHYLAWPRGLYNDTLIKLAEAAGYDALLTIHDGFNRPGDDLLHIRRTMIDGQCDDKIFRQILSDGHSRDCSGKNAAH